METNKQEAGNSLGEECLAGEKLREPRGRRAEVALGTGNTNIILQDGGRHFRL